MVEHLLAAPISFWVATAVIAALIMEGIASWHAAWAKPALVVYGTVAAWYLGDYTLSVRGEYSGFEPWVVARGFWQVTAFAILVRALIPPFTKRFCRGVQRPKSDHEVPNVALAPVLTGLAILWGGLYLTAVVMRDGKWLPLLWPPAESEKVGMFVHPGVGSGAAFLLATAGYVHLLVCALFGPIAVLGRGKVRIAALIMIAVSWPYFFFDRVRNAMLALLLPAVASYWSFNRQRLAMKAAVSALLLVMLTFWFQIVMAYRGSGTRDLQVFSMDASGASGTQGLDMLKELCWINMYLESGHYRPNWGQRYFAEFVNFVPRTFWPGKPTVGIDYAIARGFGRADGFVNATIATGMIGQGVVNFGPYLGVVAAATIIAAWVAILARLWLQRDSLPRMLLFLMGLGLTFNMGRDITLLVLFPFVFGYLGVRLLEYVQRRRRGRDTGQRRATGSARMGRM